MPHVVIVDTTVLLNILNVPGRNGDREDVIADLGRLLEEGANLLLPMGAVFETGNHIARLPDGNLRREYAEVFRDEVEKALSGSAPWVPAELPSAHEVASWLAFSGVRCTRNQYGRPVDYPRVETRPRASSPPPRQDLVTGR